jgi:hypothetical protein
MKLKSFNEHVNEAYNPNDERFARLRELGLADDPEMEDRMNGLMEEWGDDPEITKLITALRARTVRMIGKWFPTEDPMDSTAEEHFQEYVDMLQELGADELGFLEYMVLQYYNGYL